MKLALLNRRLTGLMLALALAGWGFSSKAAAQDMRVYTSVSILDDSGTSQPLSHSLTLFRAGKVYDYMEEVGEVVILEPDQHRFVILGANYTVTEVPFTQVLQFLEKADGVAKQYVAELLAKPDDAAIRTANAVQFQLKPEFEVKYQPQHLTLTGGLLSYEAETLSMESKELTRQFLEYADWTARLNYVLHPRTLLPASRLALNEELRKRGELPVTVTLTRNFDGVSKLQARHRLEWSLLPADKQSISQWENLIASDRVKRVSFHEYQDKQLVRVKK